MCRCAASLNRAGFDRALAALIEEKGGEIDELSATDIDLHRLVDEYRSKMTDKPPRDLAMLVWCSNGILDNLDGKCARTSDMLVKPGGPTLDELREHAHELHCLLYGTEIQLQLSREAQATLNLEDAAERKACEQLQSIHAQALIRKSA